MNGPVFRGRWVACAALMAGGCGAIPDIIVDAARSSAKEALQEAVENVIDDAIEDTVEELLDYADFEFPSIRESEDEEEGDVFDEEGEDVDDSAQDTGRTGKTAWDNRRHDSSQRETSRLPLWTTHDALVVETTQRATNGSCTTENRSCQDRRWSLWHSSYASA